MTSQPPGAWVLLAMILAGAACGGPQPDQESSNATAPNPYETTLTRCQELTDYLLLAPGSGDENLMVTAYYAFEEAYPSCHEAISETLEAGPERDLNLLAYQLVHLQAIRIASEAYYLEGNVETLCARAVEGVAESDRFFDAVNGLATLDDAGFTERVLQLRVMGLDTARFFEAVTTQVCTTPVVGGGQ